jgi:predicted nucleic acid-binding protein
MAGLLRGVAQGARGLFVRDEDEDDDIDDAGVEALLVRAGCRRVRSSDATHHARARARG